MRSIAHQAALRLVFSLGLFIVLLGFTSYELYSITLEKSAQERAEDLAGFYRTRLMQLDRDWELQARDFKVRLEVTRLLEDKKTGVINLQAFMTVQGTNRRFQYLLIQDRQGNKVFDFGAPLRLGTLPATLGQESGWYVGATDHTLYRVFVVPIWLGQEGTGRMALFYEIDNALLFNLATPGIVLTALHDGRPVASSGGQASLDQARASLARKAESEQRAIRWSAAADEKAQLQIDAPIKALFTKAELVLGAVTIPIVDGLILWFTLGFWLMRKSWRIRELGGAVAEFGIQHKPTRVMAEKLDSACADEHDEIAEVAGAIENMADQVLRRDRERREEEAQRRLWSMVFASSSEAIIIADRDNNILAVNESFTRMTGYREDEVVGRNPRLLSSGREPPGFFADMWQQLGDKGYWFGELQDRRKDGSLYYKSLSINVVRDAAGTVTHYIGAFLDISERMQREEQTHQLLMENQTILNNALVGIVYFRQRRIVSCNRRFEELFQYEPGELIGESSVRLYDSYENFLAIGQRAEVTLRQSKNCSEEVQLRRKDGSLFWGALNGCAIDPVQPNEGSIWIFADVTERRRAEQESGKLLQAVEQSPVSIVVTNRAGLIEYVNPGFTRITGYSRDEVIGLTPSILKTDDTPQEVYRDLWRSLLEGQVWHGVMHNRCKNGALIWEQTSISPIFDTAGEITHFVAVKEDVTERKRIEQELEAHQAHLEKLVVQRTVELSQALEVAQQADKAKDEFLANITHELRTPLSAVIGFSSLARPLAKDARQRQYLDKVNSAGKTLSSIIDDLLDLSKIAAGRLKFEIRPFSLLQVVARSSSVISFKAHEKGLELIERIDGDIPDVLVGDSLRVEQILLNLLSNAVKFTAVGHVELRVGLHAREAQRVCLNIEVEDTGIGLCEDEIGLLFKPFSQADSSTTRRFGGTGLGLAICKRLAEMMDGEISVSSREGRGTLFQVRLWLGLGQAGDLPRAEKSGQELVQVHYQRAHVLVVDDQPFNRDIVEGLLAVVGITPDLAKDGQEALDILASGGKSFDLVLMDIQMPVMDGLTATRRIRRMEGLAQLPVVAMTAHTMTHEREMEVAAGMNDHIGKPFDEAGFYRVLAQWIPQDKQRRLAPAAPAATPVAGLPLLHGVDTQAGLALLLGDEARYRHWLGDFVVEAPAAIKQMRRALSAGEPEPASIAAHSLKGRTGLLGMQQLYVMASALEAAIDAAEPTTELLRRFELGVAVMTAEIQCGLGLANTAESPVAGGAQSLPPGLPPASVTHLIARLHAGDSDCDRLVMDCLVELKDTAWAPHLQQALRHVSKFDYPAACALFDHET